MSWINRIRSTAHVLSGARRLPSTIIPESAQRRVTDFGNWPTGHVGPEQTSRVLNEIVEHVRTNYPPRQSLEVGESDSALREFTRVYTINSIEGYTARRFLQDARKNITSVLRNNRKTKVKSILKCNMERQTDSGTAIQPSAFYSGIEINLDGTDRVRVRFGLGYCDTMEERIIEKIARFQSMGSGRRLHSIIQLELHTVRYNPLRGETYIPLLKELASKKAIINMKNGDNQCFCGAFLQH